MCARPTARFHGWLPIALAVLASLGACGQKSDATPNAAATAPLTRTAVPSPDEPRDAEPPSDASTRGSGAATTATSTAGETSDGTGSAADDGRGRVEPGDSLSKILHRSGLDGPAVHELTVALGPLMDPTTIHAGQTYRVELGEGGELRTFQFDVSRVVQIAVERGEDGKLVADRRERETEIEEVVVGGTVASSLAEAMAQRGEHASLVSFFVDVFAYDLDFFVDTHPGDTFRMLVEKELVDGEFLRYRNVLAAEYAGKAGTFRAFWWQPKGAKKGRYIDGEGRGVVKTLLKTPLQYTRVSSEFNPRRMHPILHRVKGHNGVDFAAPTGTPVRAAAGGKITFRDRKKGAGNMVILKHDDGMQTLYMHLDRFRDGQKVGQHVAQKTVIGYVGSTGLATGPHLHFGVKIGGRYVDPLKVERRRGPGVGREHRRAFRRLMKERLGRLDEAAPQ